MLKFVKFLLISLFCIITSGCATLNSALTPAYKKSINKIAVVSVMGDKFKGTKIGTTVFNNENCEDDFSAFSIDNKIEDKIISYLTESSGFTATKKPEIASILSKTFKQKDMPASPTKALKTFRNILPSLKAEGIDALLIVSPYETQFEDTGVWVSGYGLVVRTFLMMWYAKAEFISYISLIDTTNEKIVMSRFFWRSGDIKFSKWQTKFSNLTSEEQNGIENFFALKVIDEIPRFLKKANF